MAKQETSTSVPTLQWKPGRGRPAVKHRGITVEMRRQILTGRLTPGERLAPRIELAEKFGVSVVTLQAAMAELTAEGYLRVDRTLGTYVADDATKLRVLAMVASPGVRESLFAQAMIRAAHGLSRKFGFRVAEYSVGEGPHSAEFDRLCDDAVHHRFAAMIGVIGVDSLLGTPVMTEPGIARVMMSDVVYPAQEGLVTLYNDIDGWLRRSIEYLNGQGRRRIAHLGIAVPTHRPDDLERQIRKYQPNMTPYWNVQIPDCKPELRYVAANLVNMLMQLEGDKRPDALLIHDDNLIDHAVAGLMSAGVAVPAQVEVLAHANFPLIDRNVFPLRRIGFDCTRIVTESLEIIAELEAGKEVARRVPIPAVFDDEIPRMEPT